MKRILFLLLVVSCFRSAAQCTDGQIICQQGYLYQCVNNSWQPMGGQTCGQSVKQSNVNNTSLKMANDTVINFNTTEDIYLYNVNSLSEIGLDNSTDKNRLIDIKWDNASTSKSYKVNAHSSIRIKMDGKSATIIDSKVVE